MSTSKRCPSPPSRGSAAASSTTEPSPPGAAPPAAPPAARSPAAAASAARPLPIVVLNTSINGWEAQLSLRPFIPLQEQQEALLSDYQDFQRA